ncbi:MAG: C40 family peptidase [Candidatus Eremiobacteraeota bacterium]|nr:C40 family peptidase [Candidatus Eremiobacteraeota bacterium]
MLRNFFARSFAPVACSLIVATPALAAGHTYTVSAGDTLSSIAAREHVNQAQLVRLNHLSDANYLSLGEVLIVSASAPTVHSHASAHASARHAKGHTRTVAVTGTSHHKNKMRSPGPRPSPSAMVAQREALWIAMHSGFGVPDLAGVPSFGSAQRMLALELRLTKTALRYLGVPYMWGGESFSGVDCSGFVQAVFRRNGIELPRTADAQFEVGRRVAGSGLQPGDLVFFQTYAEGASHVGIYLGQGQFVHASSSNGVRVDSMSESYYASRFIGARRAQI